MSRRKLSRKPLRVLTGYPRSNLWVEMRKAVEELKPELVVWEIPENEENYNLICEHWGVFWETFPKSGTMLNGYLYGPAI